MRVHQYWYANVVVANHKNVYMRAQFASLGVHSSYEYEFFTDEFRYAAISTSARENSSEIRMCEILS